MRSRKPSNPCAAKKRSVPVWKQKSPWGRSQRQRISISRKFALSPRWTCSLGAKGFASSLPITTNAAAAGVCYRKCQRMARFANGVRMCGTHEEHRPSQREKEEKRRELNQIKRSESTGRKATGMARREKARL